MRTFFQERRSFGTAIVLALAAMLSTGCQKDNIQDSVTPSVQDAGDVGHPKIIFFMNMLNGTGTKSFYVMKGCESGGSATNGTTSTIQYTGQTSTHLSVNGVTSDCDGVINGSALDLEKGASSITLGPIYYFIANQGPAGKKVLKLQVYGGTHNYSGATDFTYNATTGTWSWNASAISGRFQATQVNSPPHNCC